MAGSPAVPGGHPGTSGQRPQLHLRGPAQGPCTREQWVLAGPRLPGMVVAMERELRSGLDGLFSSSLAAYSVVEGVGLFFLIIF